MMVFKSIDFIIIEASLTVWLKSYFTLPCSVTFYMYAKFCNLNDLCYVNISVQEGCEISISLCVVNCH